MDWRVTAVAASVGAVLLSGCLVAEDRSYRVLSDAGYSDISLGLNALWGCGKGDDFTREFAATGPSGHRVTGALCCGWFKNCTIRLD